jgi:hypothetical protein
METTSTTAIATQVAQSIGLKGSVWNKKGSRFYVNGGHIKSCAISVYNTSKCKQSAYIDLESFEVRVFTDCPSQSIAWCQNESAKLAQSLAKVARLIRIKAHTNA